MKKVAQKQAEELWELLNDEGIEGLIEKASVPETELEVYLNEASEAIIQITNIMNELKEQYEVE